MSKKQKLVQMHALQQLTADMGLDKLRCAHDQLSTEVYIIYLAWRGVSVDDYRLLINDGDGNLIRLASDVVFWTDLNIS